MVKLTKTECRNLFRKAHLAGEAAAKAHTPAPMVVGSPSTPFGNDDDPRKGPVYVVRGGVCGFAWITIRPANGSFARWLKANGKGRTSDYGGCRMTVFEFGQSLELKEKYAGAFARVLSEAGIDAYCESRMD